MCESELFDFVNVLVLYNTMSIYNGNTNFKGNQSNRICYLMPYHAGRIQFFLQKCENLAEVSLADVHMNVDLQVHFISKKCWSYGKGKAIQSTLDQANKNLEKKPWSTNP